MIFLINCVMVVAVVVVHYEALNFLSRWIPQIKLGHRFRIVLGVIGALIAHALEIWLFGLAYYVLHGRETWGTLQGNYDGSVLDSVYFSFSTYTTLGFGDIEPLGMLRFVVGVESLIGLVMIAWTATFLYFHIQSQWQYDDS